MPVESRIFVVCTDRGQHDEVRLTYIFASDEGLSMPIGGGPTRTGYMFPDPDAEPTLTGQVGVSRHSYVFWCRRCGRNPSVRPEKWRELVEEFRRAGLRRVDVSLLPF